MAEKSRPPPRPLTPAAPAVRPAAARVPPRAAPLPFVAAPLPFASTEPDDRIVRLEKRVADLERQVERQQEASWDAPTAKPPSVAPPPMGAPAPTTQAAARAPEPDRREEIRALVKAAVEEATSALRAELERKQRTPPPVPVREADAPRAQPAPVVMAPMASLVPAASMSVAPVAVAHAAPSIVPSVAPKVQVVRYEIPSAHEPLGFDIPDGLDGSARRRKVAWGAFVFLLLMIGSLLSAMLVSRNR